MSDNLRHSCDDLPPDALPVTVIEIVSYLVGDGDQQFVVRVGGHPQLSAALGLLRLADDSIIRAYMEQDDDTNVWFDKADDDD